MELCNSNIKKFLKSQETKTLKKFLMFSQKNTLLVFLETETPKIFLILKETELSCISGNRNLEKILYFSGSNFLSSKNEKNVLYFGKWIFPVPCL